MGAASVVEGASGALAEAQAQSELTTGGAEEAVSSLLEAEAAAEADANESESAAKNTSLRYCNRR